MKKIKLIRLDFFLALSILLVYASSQIDWTDIVNNSANVHSLFVILMCGVLFYSTIMLTNKLIVVDEKLYFNTSFKWLLFAFGLVCVSLFLIASNKIMDGRQLVDRVGSYMVFVTNIFTCIFCILQIRTTIRK